LSSYAVTHVAVVDVENGIVRLDQTVIVTGDRIHTIASGVDLSVLQDSRCIDGRGLYLMPSLVDAHVHNFDPPVFGRMFIANGVLLVRDLGHPNEEVLPLRQALNEGTMLGPEMAVSGWVLDGDPPLVPPVSLGIKTPEEGRDAVRRQAAAGVDQIKVYSRLEKDVYLAIVDEAHKQGLKPVGHVPESIYIEEAAAAGQKSAEHLFGFEKVIGKLLGEPITLRTGGIGMDAPYWLRLPEVNHEELLQALYRIRDSGMAVCPTVIVFKAGSHLQEIQARQYPRLEYISPKMWEIWNLLAAPNQESTDMSARIWPHMQAFVAELHEAGLTLMVGTDTTFPGVIPGYAVHEEMALWQEAGIPPADILRSATSVPARFIGWDERLGTIAEGKVASMVLVRANPLEDIRNASKIEGVFLRGRYLDRSDLDLLLEEATGLAQDQVQP